MRFWNFFARGSETVVEDNRNILQRMSTEQGSGERSSKEGTRTPPLGTTHPAQSGEQATQSKPSSTQQILGEKSESIQPDQKPDSQSAQSSTSIPAITDVLARSTSEEEEQTEGEYPRQVIAVSASKGPAAFFNLARKFLATDEMCDLSALEGAIVSAVDAAHLLERSQLATIVRVSTSYVTVEPKRRRHPSQPKELEGESSQTQSQSTAESIASGSPQLAPATPASDSKPPTEPSLQVQSEESHSSPSEGTPPASRQSAGRSAGRELRRARIVITVRRTASYKRWLEENPLQAIFAREGDADTALEEAPAPPKQPE